MDELYRNTGMLGIYRKKSVDDAFDKSDGALPFKLRLIAEDELGETSARRKEALEKLEHLIAEEPDLKPKRDRDFLLRFLRVKKYNVDAAMNAIRNYYSNRAACDSVYSGFLPSKVPPSARKLVMAFPAKDVHGRLVMFLRLGAWKPEELPHAILQRAALIVWEYYASDPTAQTLGVCLFLDCHQLTMQHVSALNVGLVKRALEYFQDCMPMRLKAVHVVRQRQSFDMLYSIMKPFLKTKLASRLQLHGYRFETLHKEFSRLALPEEYGGTAPPLDYDTFWGEMDKLEALFEADNHYGYPKRYDGNFASQEEIEEALEFF